MHTKRCWHGLVISDFASSSFPKFVLRVSKQWTYAKLSFSFLNENKRLDVIHFHMNGSAWRQVLTQTQEAAWNGLLTNYFPIFHITKAIQLQRRRLIMLFSISFLHWIICKKTEILRALSLVDRCVKIRVSKHNWDLFRFERMFEKYSIKTI